MGKGPQAGYLPARGAVLTILNGRRVRSGQNSRKNYFYFGVQESLRAFLSHFFTVGVVKKSASFLTEPENSSKRVSRVKKGFQKVRRLFGSQNKNDNSADYAQQRRRPPPVAETGRSCWGSGQQDARAAQGTKRMLGAATRKARRAFQIIPRCRKKSFMLSAPAAAGCARRR